MHSQNKKETRTSLGLGKGKKKNRARFFFPPPQREEKNFPCTVSPGAAFGSCFACSCPVELQRISISPLPSIPLPVRIKQPAMGSASARIATAAVHLVTAAAILLMLARGGEAVSLWLPPPTAGGGGFLGGADRYLTREEHWMNQTLDHFNPTVSTVINRRVSLRIYVDLRLVLPFVGTAWVPCLLL